MVEAVLAGLEGAGLPGAGEVEAVAAADDAGALELVADGDGAGAGGDVDEGLGVGAVGEKEDGVEEGRGDKAKQKQESKQFQHVVSYPRRRWWLRLSPILGAPVVSG